MPGLQSSQLEIISKWILFNRKCFPENKLYNNGDLNVLKLPSELEIYFVSLLRGT
jgi:hypothetical protein